MNKEYWQIKVSISSMRHHKGYLCVPRLTRKNHINDCMTTVKNNKWAIHLFKNLGISIKSRRIKY